MFLNLKIILKKTLKLPFKSNFNSIFAINFAFWKLNCRKKCSPKGPLWVRFPPGVPPLQSMPSACSAFFLSILRLHSLTNATPSRLKRSKSDAIRFIRLAYFFPAISSWSPKNGRPRRDIFQIHATADNISIRSESFWFDHAEHIANFTLPLFDSAIDFCFFYVIINMCKNYFFFAGFSNLPTLWG